MCNLYIFICDIKPATLSPAKLLPGRTLPYNFLERGRQVTSSQTILVDKEGFLSTDVSYGVFVCMFTHDQNILVLTMYQKCMIFL